MSTKWLLYGMDEHGNDLPTPFDTEEELIAYLDDNAETAVTNDSYLYVEKVTIEETYFIKSSFKLEKMSKAKPE